MILRFKSLRELVRYQKHVYRFLPGAERDDLEWRMYNHKMTQPWWDPPGRMFRKIPATPTTHF